MIFPPNPFLQIDFWPRWRCGAGFLLWPLWSHRFGDSCCRLETWRQCRRPGFWDGKMKLRKRYGRSMENIWKNTPRDTTSDDIIKLWNCKTNIQQQMDCDVYECIWWIWHEIYRMDKSQRVIWLVHFWGCGDQDSKCFGWPWYSWFQCEVWLHNWSSSGGIIEVSISSTLFPVSSVSIIYSKVDCRQWQTERERDWSFCSHDAWGCGFGMALGLWWILVCWVWTLFFHSWQVFARLASYQPFMDLCKAGRRNLATAQPWIMDATAAPCQGLWWSDPALLWRRVSKPPLSGQLLLWIYWDQWDPSVPFWQASALLLWYEQILQIRDMRFPSLWGFPWTSRNYIGIWSDCIQWYDDYDAYIIGL